MVKKRETIEVTMEVTKHSWTEKAAEDATQCVVHLEGLDDPSKTKVTMKIESSSDDIFLKLPQGSTRTIKLVDSQTTLEHQAETDEKMKQAGKDAQAAKEEETTEPEGETPPELNPED